MRFEQLEYLIAIAETGSFRAAAQKLYITQQAISSSMKQLEEELGQELFIKESNKTRLTTYGEITLGFAQKTLEEKNSLFAQYQSVQKTEKLMQIDIGSTSSVINYILPTVIAELESKRKKVFFQLNTMENMQTVLEQVAQGEKTLGFISMNKDAFIRKFATYQDVLQMEVLTEDEIMVVINRKNYTGDKPYITRDEYNQKMRTRFNIEEVEEHRNNICVASSNDIMFHFAMLENTDAGVIMSGLSQRYFFNNKKYLALCMEDVDVTILHVAVYRKDANDTISEIVQKIRKEMHIK